MFLYTIVPLEYIFEENEDEVEQKAEKSTEFVIKKGKRKSACFILGRGSDKSIKDYQYRPSRLSKTRLATRELYYQNLEPLRGFFIFEKLSYTIL